jgi:hypothetical protein
VTVSPDGIVTVGDSFVQSPPREPPDLVPVGFSAEKAKERSSERKVYDFISSLHQFSSSFFNSVKYRNYAIKLSPVNTPVCVEYIRIHPLRFLVQMFRRA